jgi:hypothetical protein
MPAHYYYENNPKIYSTIDSLNLSDLSQEEIFLRFDSVKKKIQTGIPERRMDLQKLSSEFLIQHIDAVFDIPLPAPYT